MKKTVVVVDDEIDLCETLKDVFEDEGYTVGVAHNGAEAMRLLQALDPKPCVVILDLVMPVLDGNAVYRAMRSDPILEKIPVVITTSDPSRAPPGVLMMRKPVSLDVLVAEVRKCC